MKCGTSGRTSIRSCSAGDEFGGGGGGGGGVGGGGGGGGGGGAGRWAQHDARAVVLLRQ
jgi:hypothetical protein